MTIEETRTWDRETVSACLNGAADDVLDALDAPDTGLRDAINLVVNATMAYLDHGIDQTLEEVIDASYERDEGGNGPLEWAREGL